MSADPEEQTRKNLGWFYMDALRSVAKTGKWPTSLTPYERRRIRAAGLVELVYIPRCGWQPRLSGDKGIHNDDR